MDKKIIEKLAEKSFKGQELDEKYINLVSKKLKRSDLKEYIKRLNVLMNKKIVKIYIPNEDSLNTKALYSAFKKLYPTKKIVIEVDPSLMLGVKVENNDNIYELSLKNAFENLKNQVEEKYDR